jgi:hypothetical protein
MPLTKQQKIYAAVLLLAGVAFGVDRWVIGHAPEEASAAVPRRPTSALPAPAPAQGGNAGVSRGATGATLAPPAGASTAAARQARSLAVRFQEVVKGEGLDLANVPDAFQPSRRWDPPDMLLPPPVAPPPPPRPDLAAQFRSRYKLTAVMKGRAGLAGVASINGRMYVVGHTIDDMKLVEINEQSVVFEGTPGRSGEKIQVKLVIDTPQPQGMQ